ncbi:ExbD/TolR family protein [Hydrocarboniphaga effusa]|jgi:biopolymer transport protein TolR|uniref:ExbD/TolR family protein n=1 Tax=Hydrocarboniphaga effusa TaxID=243629 RepID=UPI00398C0F8B
MKLATPKPRPAGTIDMVPMINFAFLLLIFVILVGAIATPDALPVNPPRSNASAQQPPDPDTVVIDASGRVAFEGQIVEPDELLLKAQAWQASTGDKALIVKADAATQAERVVVILEALRAAGVMRAQLLTTQRGGG